MDKQLDYKDNDNFTIYDVVHWDQIIRIHILPNISISKDHQAMKFCQLTECSMINIFLQKPDTKIVEKLIPDPFLKIKILHISGRTV